MANKKKENSMYLSASRIKTYLTCSYTYYLTYECGFRDLDEGNDGSKRGTICHLVLECLIEDKHHHYIKKIQKAKSCYKVPQIKRLIMKHAKILGVDDEENLGLMDKFIQVGLKADFFCEGWDLQPAEEEFNIVKDRYKIRGFIDKHALQLAMDKARIDDYKTSKNKFTGKDAEFNIQAFMYALAIYEKYGVSEIDANFIFLKFPRAPFQSFTITESQLKGFEYWLGNMYSFLSDYGPAKAASNYAKHNDCWRLCGKGPSSKKKDGSPAWVCQWKYPFIYYEGVDEKGKVRKAKTEEKLLDKGVDPDTVEEKFYRGCPSWDLLGDYKKGKR